MRRGLTILFPGRFFLRNNIDSWRSLALGEVTGEDGAEDGLELGDGPGISAVALQHEASEAGEVAGVDAAERGEVRDGELVFVAFDVAGDANVGSTELKDGVVGAFGGLVAREGGPSDAGVEAVGAGVLVAGRGADGRGAAAVGGAAGRIGPADGPCTARRAGGGGSGAAAAGLPVIGLVVGLVFGLAFGHGGSSKRV
jgi:hypothetical protein